MIKFKTGEKKFKFHRGGAETKGHLTQMGQGRKAAWRR